MINPIIIMCSFLFVHALPLFHDKVHLERLSTIYLPYMYNGSSPVYGFFTGAVEQTSYDPINHIMYIVGGHIIHIIDINDVTLPTVLYHMEFDNVDVTDIEVCGDYVFVAMDNLLQKEDGRVVVFDKYSAEHKLTIKYNISVGSLPDMILPTKDCGTVLVAVEAEAYQHNGDIIDPEAGVGIIKITENNYSYKKLDFKSYNSKWLQLEDKGLRFVYRDNNNTFANDVEPEYITFNKDETKAYICLQENNAIAVVNIRAEIIENILPLGFKKWGRLDASDTNGIKLMTWPIYGMYQPDSIHVIEVSGKSYLVTANEGDSKDYSEWGGPSEEVRVKDVVISENSTISIFAKEQNIAGSFQNNDMLGRLKITTTNGRNENGTYDALFAFGGRSFSIWTLDDMELVYDSISDMEELHQQYIPDLFNSNNEQNTETVAQTLDTRSDDKGPEPESLAVAHIGNDVIIFIGNERPGSIFVYKITGDAGKPQFQSLWHGVNEKNGTWEDLYNRHQISELDPEDLRYIPSDKSPTGQHLLTAAGTVSGTFSIFKINGVAETSNSQTDQASTTYQGFYWISIAICFNILITRIYLF